MLVSGRYNAPDVVLSPWTPHGPRARSCRNEYPPVLSSVAPQLTDAAGKVAEREGAWFKRALGEANKIVALAPLAPAGRADPVQDLFDELYVNMRSAISHAKSGRRVLRGPH